MTRFVAVPPEPSEMHDILSARPLDFLSHKHKNYLAAVAELTRQTRAD